jgi:CubicO group peptidase (beta-lactamase class C family)
MAIVTGAAPAGSQALSPEMRGDVDRIFAVVDKPDSPGCALAVYQNGDIVYARGYGLASVEHRAPVTPATVFDIGSTSKQFTAFSVLLLERDGKLSLEDEVQRYLPELPRYERPVTIRHLMLHTSGLRDYLTLWALAGMKTENWTTQDDAVRLVVRQRRSNFVAGDEWLYSNTGYLLLAEIVARVSGKPLPAFATERIFAPLGMTHTFYLDDHTRVVPSRATAYAPRDGGGLAVDMSNFEQTGDGAVQTTVQDLLLWDRNFYDPRVGDRALLDRAQAVGTLNSGKALDYAAGLTIGSYRGLRTVRHGGAWAGYRADLLRFPDERTSIACLCNFAKTNPGALANRVADVVLAARLKPADPAAAPDGRPGVSVAPARLEMLAGFYENEKAGTFRRFAVKDGGLRYGAGSGQPLRALFPDRFVPDTPGVAFFFPAPAPGGVQEVHVVRDGQRPEVARRLPVPPPAVLEDFAGSYTSDELETTWVLTARDGRLTVQVRHDPPEGLTLVKPDVFVADNGVVLRFEREAGSVQRVLVQAGRVTRLEFVRR